MFFCLFCRKRGFAARAIPRYPERRGLTSAVLTCPGRFLATKRTRQRVGQIASRGAEFCLIFNNIGTLSPKSFGYLRAISAVPDNEENYGKSITQGEAKWIQKTNLVVRLRSRGATSAGRPRSPQRRPLDVSLRSVLVSILPGIWPGLLRGFHARVEEIQKS